MQAVWNILVWVVLPLWVIAGFLDYLCHRKSHIEEANGARESLIHWLMLAEVALPLTMAVFLRINALMIVVMLVCLVAHEVTGYYDLKLAMATRRVTILEHQVHSALEILPLTAILLMMILHWPQTEALVGFGPEPPQWYLGPKQLPRWGELIPPAAAFLVIALLPYAEEFVRGLRARRQDHRHRVSESERTPRP